MSKVKKNIIANFVGNGWMTLLGLAFIPFYVRFIGIEAYGLIGFFAAMQSIPFLFDLGLSNTLNRELAQLSTRKENAQKMRNLVRSLEIINWTVSVLIGIILILLASIIAENWFQPVHLSPNTIKQTMMIMSLALCLQLPTTFYHEGLNGLQKQVLVNIIVLIVSTFRSIGVLFVLWKISPTIQAYFTWQIISNILHIILMAVCLWINLPRTGKMCRFEVTVLRDIWRFATGVSGIKIVRLILYQTDRFILSKFLSLETFGYYTLAKKVTTSLQRIIEPVASSVYPAFSQLVAENDGQQIKQLYHRSCQLISVLIIPFAIVLTFFSREILFLWTQDMATTENTALILSFLTIGVALSGIMVLPNILQLAYGWIQPIFFINLFLIFIVIPLFYKTVISYGAVGAAFVWIVINGCYVVANLQVMHRRLLIKEKIYWYVEDIGQPMLAALFVVSLGYLFLPRQIPKLYMLFELMGITLVALFLSSMAASQIRTWIFHSIYKTKLYRIKW